MKLSVLLETIITSGLSMLAHQHGGVIDSSAKLHRILAGATMPETGYLQNRSEADIKIQIKQAIVSRNLSLLIDLVKEIYAYWPGESLQYGKAILEMLEEEGYTTQPLYLERDPGEILPGHPTQDIPTGQVIYRLRQVYSCIVDPKLDLDTRLQGVNIFISMLICSPHLQRKVIALCITPEIQANHFDPLLPQARLVRLRTILSKMARDELYDLPSEDKPPVVPPLQIVEEEETDVSKYEPKPEPWLHFTGTEHLVAMKQVHGTLQEQISVFDYLLHYAEGNLDERISNAVAYIHRSKHQKVLAVILVGEAGVEELENLNDSRLRANTIRKLIDTRIRKGIRNGSIYQHPKRTPAPEKVTGPGLTKHMQQNLEELLKHLTPMVVMESGLGKTLKDIKVANDVNPTAAVNALMSQLNFVNGADRVMVDETTNRVQTALPDLFNADGTLDLYALTNKSNTAKALKSAVVKADPRKEPVHITGGDAQLRDDIAKLFTSRGIAVKFDDEVPEICVEEIHTYQVRCGGALVSLQHNVEKRLCILTAVPLIGDRAMEPVKWETKGEDVLEVWNNIRECLKYSDAYYRIQNYLDNAGLDAF